jgi:glycosyltransferase involved in cell wall biosynthesis
MERVLMRLVFITDNGFSENDHVYYFNAANHAHTGHLRKYFDEFIFLARKDRYDKSNFRINNNWPVFLFEKYDLLGIYKKLVEVVKDADAVICYGINGYFAYKVAKKYKKPVIVYVGGDAYDILISKGTLKARTLAPIIRYIEKKKCINADYVHYCDNYLIERYPTKGELLACSGVVINVDEENLSKRINKIRNKRDKKFVIGLIGHTKNNLKGVDTAIKAIKKLNDDFELQIVGKGDPGEFANLADNLGIRDRIKFMGTLKAGDEIFHWLDNIDIYIHPSLVEGLPRAVIEAMSRGCPVISSNAGGLPRLIDVDFRIAFGDYTSLANKLMLLSNNLHMMEEQARKNFERSDEFSPSKREEKYDAFYGKFTGKPINAEYSNVNLH